MSMENELDSSSVKELMTRLTGAPYEISMPPKSLRKQPRWFVWSPDLYYAEKTAHAKAVWLGYDNILRFESADFGNTSNWVERSYGEDGAIKSMEFDYRFSAEEVVRKKLAKEFPIVGRHLERWDKIVAKVSSEKRIGLELIFDGMEQTAWFKVGAIVVWRPDRRSNEELIKGVVEALKEAYGLIISLEGTPND